MTTAQLDTLAATAGAADKPAYIMVPSGITVTYGEFEADSNRYAHLFRSLGLQAGDHVAMVFSATPSAFKLTWGARRAGLVYTIVSPHLSAAEVAYIVSDCGAKAVFAVEKSLDLVRTALAGLDAPVPVYGVDGGSGDAPDSRELIADLPTSRIADESEGTDMLYSSGTTGRPKGIVVGDGGMSAGSDALVQAFAGLWHFDSSTVYLSTGPLYHSAPLRSCTTVFRLGGTAVVMEKFDARYALELMEKYRVTHTQWVPTMFVRMLRLPEEERLSFDLSAHRVAVHAAAPCPRSVKEQMMAWWGPIIYEYYGATESIGFVHADPQEWLAHPGTVGRPLNAVAHITDEEGNELPIGTDGLVFFSGGTKFEYYNDADKTDSAYDKHGWLGVGDIGHVDEDGFLYLTDRQTFMIISGGVNIYPQEIEDLLLGHPEVLDAAVVGIPDEEMGEQVKAVVTPVDLDRGGPEFERELIDYCRANAAHYKCPRSVDFWPQLPRRDNGKLYKRQIRDHYLKAAIQ